MSLSGLLPVINADPELRQALDQAAEAPGTGRRPDRAPLPPPAAGRGADRGRPVHGRSDPAEDADDAGGFALAVTATAREAEELAAALGSLLGEDRVGYFPAWETLPHERLSPRSDTSGQRLAVLRRLAHPDSSDPRSGPLQVVTTPVRSLLQPMVSGLGELAPVKLVAGQAASLVRHGDSPDRDRLCPGRHGRAPR